MNIVIDSDLAREKVLAQNPANPAPAEILANIDVLSVRYLGYDGKLHAGQIVMHVSVIPDIKTFFKTALDLSFPIEKVIPVSATKYRWNDESSCEDNNSSGYNYRTIHGTSRLSKHALGLAFDINTRQNVYIKFDQALNEIYRSPKDGIYDSHAPGTLTDGHPLVLLMEGLGWEWGGRWQPTSGRIDYQHLEKDI